ncbi:hypothetical protein GQ457_10G011440 [Hibiscus cannabinus]
MQDDLRMEASNLLMEMNHSKQMEGLEKDVGGFHVFMSYCESWDVVCRPRVLGGLGVVDLRFHNFSLLAKWAGRFATETSSLWRAVLVAKYGEATPGWRINAVGLRVMSPVWRQIVSTIVSPELSPFLGIANYSWKVGSGDAVLFWLDPWCLELPLKEVFPRLYSLAIAKLAWVSDYAQQGSFAHDWWESYFRRSLRSFELDGLRELRALVLPFQLRELVGDRLFWKATMSGQFSVQAFRLLFGLWGRIGCRLLLSYAIGGWCWMRA